MVDSHPNPVWRTRAAAANAAAPIVPANDPMRAVAGDSSLNRSCSAMYTTALSNPARSRGRVVLWEFWRNPAPDAGVEAQKQTARGVAPRAVQASSEP